MTTLNAEDGYIAAQGYIEQLIDTLKPLAEIADAFDDNALGAEAKKFWGSHNQHQNHTSHQKIELFHSDGGKCYLTLQDCMRARMIIKAYK